MPTIDEWKSLKYRYQSLRTSVNGVLADLDSCKGAISTVSDNFSKTLVIDDSSFCEGTLSSTYKSVNDMVYELRNKVVPALNSKISEINREIERAEAEVVE